MQKIEAQLLQLCGYLMAFLVASFNQAKTYKVQLEDMLNDAEGKVRDAFVFMIADCEHWLSMANDLLASCLLANKRVGIIVEKYRMNQQGAKEDILLLTKRIDSTLIKVKTECLELLGAGVYHKTKEYTKDIMTNPEKLTNVSEMDDLLKDLKEMDVFVGKERAQKSAQLIQEVV